MFNTANYLSRMQQIVSPEIPRTSPSRHIKSTVSRHFTTGATRSQHTVSIDIFPATNSLHCLRTFSLSLSNYPYPIPTFANSQYIYIRRGSNSRVCPRSTRASIDPHTYRIRSSSYWVSSTAYTVAHSLNESPGNFLSFRESAKLATLTARVGTRG